MATKTQTNRKPNRNTDRRPRPQVEPQAQPPLNPPLPLVRPGERALLLSHHEYSYARAQGQGLEDYDLLMRPPDEQEPADGADAPEPRWQPVPAEKYLKHRASGWREAQAADELPPKWLRAVRERNSFPARPSDREQTSA